MAEQGGSQVKRALKTRHISMISLGGSIGTGLFVASGSRLICRFRVRFQRTQLNTLIQPLALQWDGITGLTGLLRLQLILVPLP